jgi:hypothetical protein
MQTPPTKQQRTRPLKTRQRQSKTRCGKAKSKARLDHDTPDQTSQTRPEIDEPMKNHRLSGKSFPKQTLPREDMLSRFQNRYFREKTRGRQAEKLRQSRDQKEGGDKTNRHRPLRCSHSVETIPTKMTPLKIQIVKKFKLSRSKAASKCPLRQSKQATSSKFQLRR